MEPRSPDRPARAAAGGRGSRARRPPPQRLPEPVERVLETVERIPAGHVLTYGQVAELAGYGGARFTGTVLSRYGSDVPWWRVVRAGGHPPRGLERAAYRHYVEEGTALLGAGPDGYRIDLAVALWRPTPPTSGTWPG